VLTAKQKIAMSTDYDWFIHADADEWLCAPRRGETLATAIARADREGFTCINFHELAFVPIEGEDFEAEDYSSRMTTYYFFQPYYPRLMRGWKAGAGLDNVETGGHMVGGEQRRVCPEDFYLRHYISLSESYVRRKYLYRKFSEEGLARGWHKNRLSIPPENLRVRPVPGMRSLPHAASMEFDLSQPFTKHFWQW
ncbi:MAG TPA: hypothetical protein VH184_23535, partial [Dongiaceae bacterium]|nr:hypothetical protein [Dongiaceae bacterium]